MIDAPTLAGAASVIPNASRITSSMSSQTSRPRNQSLSDILEETRA
jgi:hypothetical protein